MRKIIVLLLFLIIFLKAPLAFADNEFATDYQVRYEVQSTGVTEVTESITLKNLTDRYYASNFNLTIGSTRISNVKAFDSQGNLESNLSRDNNQSTIKVKFSQQVVGKDKSYNFTLKFDSPDFAEKNGQVWQVTIPKISTTNSGDNYSLLLLVPSSFGDPTSIAPEPVRHSEESGKLVYRFDKSQITTTGVLANFGTSQLYHFQLGYELTNDNLLPALAQIPIPPDTSYQQVMINKLTPEPENVTVDIDGNYIAWYKIAPKSFIKATVEGLANLHFNPSTKIILSQNQISSLTSSKKYWEKDNPIIKAKLLEIFKDKPSSYNQSSLLVKEKAGLINQFVVNYLKYNDNRVKSGDFDRLGSLTALSNPDSSLCGEFTDLFVTLARAENIPARELIGYANTSNQDLRPLSFAGTPLHAWPEYYDSEVGWVMIDPTWQNTSGGVDYFNKIDLNHFVLAIRGDSSEEPNPSNEVKVEFSNLEFKPSPKADVNINLSDQVFAGLPTKASILVKNRGTQVINEDKLLVSSEKLSLSSINFDTPKIPPYGHVSYDLNIRSSSIFESFTDFIKVSFNQNVFKKSVYVKSFFSSNIFPYLGLLIIIFFFGIYFSILHLHRTKFYKSNLPSKKINQKI